jgi:hypothetical protein
VAGNEQWVIIGTAEADIPAGAVVEADLARGRLRPARQLAPGSTPAAPRYYLNTFDEDAELADG